MLLDFVCMYVCVQVCVYVYHRASRKAIEAGGAPAAAFSKGARTKTNATAKGKAGVALLVSVGWRAAAARRGAQDELSALRMWGAA